MAGNTPRKSCAQGAYTKISNGEANVTFDTHYQYGGRMVIAQSLPAAGETNYKSLAAKTEVRLNGLAATDFVYFHAGRRRPGDRGDLRMTTLGKSYNLRLRRRIEGEPRTISLGEPQLMTNPLSLSPGQRRTISHPAPKPGGGFQIPPGFRLSQTENGNAKLSEAGNIMIKEVA